MTVIFVGQGPSRKTHLKLIEDYPSPEKRALVADSFAIMGNGGKRIAKLLGIEAEGDASALAVFGGSFHRTNLNLEWGGKKGRGDKFDKELGAARAAELLQGEHDRFVLLGKHVARSFGIEYVPLKEFTIGTKRALVLPHPSGLVRFWNNPHNVQAAAQTLSEFVA